MNPKLRLLLFPRVVKMTNLLINGSFIATTGWTGVENATVAAANNILSITGSGSGSYCRAYQDMQTKPLNSSFYFVAQVRVTNASCTSMNIRLRDGVAGTLLKTITINTPTQDEWYPLFDLAASGASLAGNLFFLCDHFYADAATANGKVMQVMYALVTNLTSDFSSGDKPTATAMAKALNLFNSNAWFNETANVPI